MRLILAQLAAVSSAATAVTANNSISITAAAAPLRRLLLLSRALQRGRCSAVSPAQPPPTPTQQPQQRSLGTARDSMASSAEHTKVCIIGSGPAGHTAAIYAARAELAPILFEGMLANGVAAGGQLTTTSEVENYPGFPHGILGMELCTSFRAQSERFGTKIYTETVTRVDLSRRPFVVRSDERTVTADTLIIATGAVARRMHFTGADESGFWNRGVSACAVCDGALPLFRNKPIMVIGGGDSAMEEAMFMTRYGSKVYIVHRRDELRASKIMQRRVTSSPKIELIYSHVPVEAHGDTLLRAVTLESTKTHERRRVEVSGLFFAIGHDPATKFLDGQLELDADGYIVTKPGAAETSVAGVFACGDVQDKKWRQAITAAGSGCMAALQAEHFLAALEEHDSH